MSLTPDLVRERLRGVRYPGYSRDIVSFGLIKDIEIQADRVFIRLALTTGDPKIPDLLRAAVQNGVEALPGVSEAVVQLDLSAPAQPVAGESGLPQTQIPGVKQVIAVASGKGGVGKSTVAANLALALAKNRRVGLCDCDIYGPSQALMFGTQEQPRQTQDEKIEPIRRHGLALMSMGFLLGDDTPALLRGPMVTRYTQQFLRQVAWGELDLLILDLPPGTGDIQLTIVQTVALAGAVLVTTPQEVALIDVRKAARMFTEVQVPILGVMENMSYFIAPDTGTRYDIFGTGGGEREAARLHVPLLARIPLEQPLRESGDRGVPLVAAQPESPAAEAFFQAAEKILTALAKPSSRST